MISPTASRLWKLRYISLLRIGEMLQYVRSTRSRIAMTLSTLGGRTAVPAFWRNDERNFGDLLTPALLTSYGHDTIWVPSKRARIVGAGSILGAIPPDYEGVLLGTGFISERMKRSFPKAKILALRGELTRVRTNAPSTTLLADPGLLASRLLNQPRDRQVPIGVVPHYADRADARVSALISRHGKSLKLVDVSQEPSRFVDELATCNYVISSSLHGVIAADALGLPRAWIELSDRVVGQGFKFRDYASSLGQDLVPQTIRGDESLRDLIRLTSSADTNVVQAKISALHSHFGSLTDYL